MHPVMPIHKPFLFCKNTRKKGETVFFFDMDTDFCFSDKGSYFPEIPEIDSAAAASVFVSHIPAFDMLMTAHIKQSFQVSAFKAADQIASKPSE